MGEKDLVESFELGAELSALVAQGRITPAIAEKIKEKVREKNMTLSKEQLYKLVERINAYLKKTPTEKPPVEGDVGKVLQTIENLHRRVEELERRQDEWMKSIDTKIRTLRTDEIRVPGEKISFKAVVLDNLPNDPESVVITMKWLQYLVDKVGKENISKVLDYYVDIGWITDEVKIKLLEYCDGITEEGGERRDLVAKDHIQSFLYIQKLKGNNIDEHLLGKIERELSKLNKSLENLSIR